MSLAHDPLPSDLEVLRVFAAGLQAELARKDMEFAANAAEIHAKTLHIEKLRMQLAVLRRARFGRSSEKLDGDIEQLELLIGELEEETAQGEARAEAADPAGHRQARARRQPVRRPLPEHLPREVVTHDPPCTCPGCGGTVFSRVGQDEREVLEYVPSSFKVTLATSAPRSARSRCCTPGDRRCTITRIFTASSPAAGSRPTKHAGSRHTLRPASSTTHTAVSFCETSKPTNRVIKQPPMVRTAGPQRPDRGIMDDLYPRRDYPMSTHAPAPCR